MCLFVFNLDRHLNVYRRINQVSVSICMCVCACGSRQADPYLLLYGLGTYLRVRARAMN